MPRLRRALALSLLPSLACQPVPTQNRRGSDPTTAPDSPFVASAPGGDLVVFPPAPEAEPRRALPRHLAEAEQTGEAPTEVEWPELDDDGTFEIAGQTLRVRFNRSITPPAAGIAALTLDPPVAGTVSWVHPWALNFRADAPFDPETEYTVALGELHDDSGERVAEGWQGKFTAEPRVHIGGKVLSYLPKVGEPQMVVVRPDAPPQVGPTIEPHILFDQPIALTDAAALLDAKVDGTALPLTLRYPSKDLFDGVEVKKEHVVIVGHAPLAPGQTMTLVVNDQDGDEVAEHTYDVAPALTFDRVGCNDYYEERSCTWDKKTLGLEGNRFAIRFNNPINASEKVLSRALSVTPAVKNLRVRGDSWRSDGVVWVTGEFRSSTHYRVKLAPIADRFGSKLAAPVRFEVDVAPQSASVSMPEGQQVLDEAGSRAFTITTRNVEQAKVELWEVEPRAEAWAEASRRLGARERPMGEPDLVIPVKPKARRDRSVKTSVDLLDSVRPGSTYLARLTLDTPAFGATPPSYPSWSMAARPPTALITPHDDSALALHVHAGSNKTLVHVATLGDGTPVAGARLLVDGKRVPGVTTDAQGMATLAQGFAQGSRHHVFEVDSDQGRATLVLGASALHERTLAPELAGGATPLESMRAFVLSDRGVYRPGATVELKGMAQFREHGKLRPLSTMPVGLRVIAPTGKQVFSEDGMSNTMGSMVSRFAVPKTAEIGRYRVQFVAPLRDDAVLASATIQVAEFEPPRFTVDVEASSSNDGRTIAANVRGRYLFGAAMEDAPVTWTVRRRSAAIPQGPLAAKGFVFRQVRSWWDDEQPKPWLRIGEGTLDAKGELAVAPAVEMPTDDGPQSFVIEAEVTDESHRAIAGRNSVVLHPATHYAGLKLEDRWLDVKEVMPLQVGVIDQQGKTVSATPVQLRLERLDWKRVRRPGAGGYADERWHEVAQEVARCTTSGEGTEGCALRPPTSGSYRVSAWLGEHRGGSVRVWAWGRGGHRAAPAPGRRIEIVADRSSYDPGDTATLMVRNPFPAATAILTVQQGEILHHETRTVTDSAARFSVKLGPEHAPHAHATITLLPQGAKDEARVDWKMGAIALPVALSDRRLDVTVASDRKRYGPGDSVDIVVDVSQGGAAVTGAEVALAVVDEGVLRLTNFHAPDPVAALYPGQGLDLWVDDSRRLLAEQLRRSHVAGDGSGAGSHSLVSTRKNFVRTALWKPQLITDDDGRAHVRFTLPDNLTRFRMMAVVVDTEGRGGVHEADFEVQKPLMAIPAVPRFAAIGDSFEAAVLVHNNRDHTELTTVTMGSRKKQVEIAAGGRARVGFTLTPTTTGPMALRFAVADHEGTVRDRVEVKLPVQAPGIDERPYLHGTFIGRQQVALQVPQEVFAAANADDHVTITVGQNLWPELGERLQYLIGYPHGCVEQTTSSTLPLLAAREILPRLGLTRYSDEELRTMIASGVTRLSTMRTADGGLAYWPGGDDSNPFGTAYATLAIARAQRLGIDAPEGMVDGMQSYMVRMLERDQLPHGYGVEVKASLALALAELEALPPERADALWDTADEQGLFGTATLALAFASLPGQDDRVASLLDTLERSFDSEGNATVKPTEDFHYYGSPQRTMAQAALALHRLRPRSTTLPTLIGRLAQDDVGYTTQSTAYGLLALSERIVGHDDEASRVRALLDGSELTPELADSLALGPSARRYRVPLSKLRGQDVRLVLESESDKAQSFMVSARWRRPGAAAGSLAATTTQTGPDIYRVITDVKGRTVDFDKIAPGQVLRVVLLARLPEHLSYDRRGYLAITDRIPAGFEAMQPDLWTVAEVPEIDEDHPLYRYLRWSGSALDHMELRDDRAHFYFDRIWSEWVHATYLMRATTPGEFTAPPAMAELMYEPNSAGYSESRSFTVTP